MLGPDAGARSNVPMDDHMLSSIADLSPVMNRALPASMHPSNGSPSSFTQLLDESLRAHAAQRGYELPIPPAGPTADHELETADEIWDRAVAQSQAGAGGIADALMKSLSDAADRCWQQRRDHEHGRTATTEFEFDF